LTSFNGSLLGTDERWFGRELQMIGGEREKKVWGGVTGCWISFMMSGNGRGTRLHRSFA